LRAERALSFSRGPHLHRTPATRVAQCGTARRPCDV